MNHIFKIEMFSFLFPSVWINVYEMYLKCDCLTEMIGLNVLNALNENVYV